MESRVGRAARGLAGLAILAGWLGAQPPAAVPERAPLYLFDNAALALSPERQVELARRHGYGGIFYTTLKEVPERLAAHRQAGARMLGVYTGMNVAAAKPGYSRDLPGAVEALRGSDALVTFTLCGVAESADHIAVPVIREAADLAARAGLKLALYPHYGCYMARVEDALRLCRAAARPNVGIVFNLAHWLRSGDGDNLDLRLRQAIDHTLLVSINGADRDGHDWTTLIQRLDRGSYDVAAFVRGFRSMGYRGPFALQCHGITGDPEEYLAGSIRAWRLF